MPNHEGGLFSSTSKSPAKRTGKAAKNTIDKAKDTVTDGIPKPNKLARKLAAKAVKAVARRALNSGAEALRTAADRAAETSKEAAEKTMNKRPPVQASATAASDTNV